MVVGPVAVRQIDCCILKLLVSSLFSIDRDKSIVREELDGLKTAALELCYVLPLLVLVLILGQRSLDMVDNADDQTVLALLDEGFSTLRLVPTPLNLVHQVEVDNIFVDEMANRALHLEMPVGLCGFGDGGHVLKSRFDLQVESSH